VAEVSSVLFNDRFGPQTVASVWEPAAADPDRVAPQPARNLAIGALLGIVTGSGLALGMRRRGREQLVRPIPPRREPLSAAAPVSTAVDEVPEAPLRELEPGEWTLGDVERLLERHGSAFPERLDELGFYLASFRDVAGAQGRLPRGVQVVVEDVFAELIERDRVPRR
jgi:hypothetical protein